MKVIEAPTIRPRGRKAQHDPKLLANLGKIKVGTWALFDEYGKVTDAKKQSALGQSIRSHFATLNRAGERVTVRWSPDGDCQVGVLAVEAETNGEG